MKGQPMKAVQAFEIDRNGKRVAFSQGQGVPADIVKEFNLVEKGLVYNA